MASPNRDGPRVPGVRYGITGSRSRSMGSAAASGTGAPRTVSPVTRPRPPWRTPSRTKPRRPTTAPAWSNSAER